MAPEDRPSQESATQNLSTVLKTISKSFGKSELELHDRNSIGRNAQNWNSITEFTSQFQVHMNKKTKKLENWKPHHWITFKIHANLQVEAIRNHCDIESKLQAHNGRLTHTEWSDQDKDACTSALGFLVGCNPKHCTSKQAHDDTNNWIQEITETPIKSTPLWRPQVSMSSAVVDGKTHRCGSFDVTCRTQDAGKLRSLLETTFTDERFLDKERKMKTAKCSPCHLERNHPKCFASMVDCQADENTHLVIAVEGMPAIHMKQGFNKTIKRHCEDVKHICEHKNTHAPDEDGKSVGRWNLVCPISSFDSTASKVFSEISALCENFTDNPHVAKPPHTHKPRVTSKICLQEAHDDNSDGTRNSFASFFENSSVASCQKESFEDDCDEATPTNFGSPTDVTQPAESTEQSSPAKSTSQPPTTLNFLEAASPQVSEITPTNDAVTIHTSTTMFANLQSQQMEHFKKDRLQQQTRAPRGCDVTEVDPKNCLNCSALCTFIQ